ncbi:Cold-inducible protein YdjO [Paenibacillus sophorae]|uniref:Cold-inducible protein YdjO n=1 Tax=Paenibacillus sophorae TaxID=1333845 RepID=A0A1H8TK85_9BACL|nr:cold-shock protein [Paenibacillus sophorae]QWU16260.1 cold-shock protein [Paenibacillus sophorae]SEO91265.1 Cold-inducible protein YdjO [Paenibacillus sophorae]
MNYRKKPLEEIPEENTAVWSCTNDDCNGWMRDNFTFDVAPTCPLCSAPMEQSMRMLPQLLNSNSNPKALKKGISIS